MAQVRAKKEPHEKLKMATDKRQVRLDLQLVYDLGKVRFPLCGLVSLVGG
jgi:hypothetical protein